MPMRTCQKLTLGAWLATLILSPIAAADRTARLEPTPDTKMIILEDYDFRVHRHQWVVRLSDFARGPAWNIESAEPPLLPRAAFLIAQGRAGNLLPNSEFRPKRVELRSRMAVWFYVVELEPVNPFPVSGGRMAPLKI